MLVDALPQARPSDLKACPRASTHRGKRQVHAVLALHVGARVRGTPPEVSQVSAEGSRVSFVIPAASLFNSFGAGDLTFNAKGTRHFTRCEGVPACTSPFSAFAMDGQLPLTVAP